MGGGKRGGGEWGRGEERRGVGREGRSTPTDMQRSWEDMEVHRKQLMRRNKSRADSERHKNSEDPRKGYGTGHEWTVC